MWQKAGGLVQNPSKIMRHITRFKLMGFLAFIYHSVSFIFFTYLAIIFRKLRDHFRGSWVPFSWRVQHELSTTNRTPEISTDFLHPIKSMAWKLNDSVDVSTEEEEEVVVKRERDTDLPDVPSCILHRKQLAKMMSKSDASGSGHTMCCGLNKTRTSQSVFKTQRNLGAHCAKIFAVINRVFPPYRWSSCRKIRFMPRSVVHTSIRFHHLLLMVTSQLPLLHPPPG